MKRMKAIKFLLNVIVLAALFSSCKKDSDIFTPNPTTPGLDTNWVASITDQSLISQLKKSLNRDIILDSIDASAGGSFQTSEGLTVTILPQSFELQNGQPATGKIYAETILMKQKGDMVRLDKPTTSAGRILISGSQVFIKVRKENEELKLAAGKTIYIKYQESNTSSTFKVFHGDENNIYRFNWNVTSDAIGISALQGIEINSSRLRWISPNYFADTSGSRVNVITSLPADYTNGNTSVFLVFKDIKSVVGMYGDINNKKFSSGKVPSGKAAVVVSITKKGNNSFYLSHENIITGQPNLNGIQTVPLKPQPTSLTDIKAYLNTL